MRSSSLVVLHYVLLGLAIAIAHHHPHIAQQEQEMKEPVLTFCTQALASNASGVS